MEESKIIDVCCRDFIGGIFCDKPCLEGYDVSNLVSKNVVDRKSGFMVERFIGPPVETTFEFKCGIDMKYVMIYCKVGTQKSTGIELLYTSPHFGDFRRVGSGVLTDDKSGFVFHRFSENIKNQFGDQFCFQTFNSSCQLSSISKLKIKIFRTKGCSLPVLGQVKIWGIPCNLLNTNEMNALKERSLCKRTNPKSASNDLCPEKKQRQKRSSKCEPDVISFTNNHTLSIPEEFLDPITCDIMTQPVTLPSGKVVDSTTLEKYHKAECHWGRGPSDPFTGILFTDNYKPVAAALLKSRIDKFLSDHSDCEMIHKVPRIVGRDFNHTRKSEILSGVGVSKLITYHNLQQHKIADISGTSESSKSCHQEDLTFVQNKNQPTSSYFKSTETDTFKADSRKISFFDERMERSLESTLKSTLASLPKLTADKTKEDKAKLITCSVCKSLQNLFSIPCKHFICRQCLLCLKNNGSNEILCSICSSSFKSSGVQRVHVL